MSKPAKRPPPKDPNLCRCGGRGVLITSISAGVFKAWVACNKCHKNGKQKITVGEAVGAWDANNPPEGQGTR